VYDIVQNAKVLLYLLYFFFFFFSSRRRHTRFSRDWSSDVCSSDLKFDKLGLTNGRKSGGHRDSQTPGADAARAQPDGTRRVAGEIGRASCRERVEIWGVAGCLEEKR